MMNTNESKRYDNILIYQVRAVAIERGANKFYPGCVCANGHFCEWYTLANQKVGKCTDCNREQARTETSRNYQRRYYRRHRDELLARDKEYKASHAEQIRKRTREYRERNRELIAKCKRRWYERNRAEVAAYNKAYYRERKERMVASAL